MATPTERDGLKVNQKQMVRSMMKRIKLTEKKRHRIVIRHAIVSPYRQPVWLYKNKIYNKPKQILQTD